MPTAFKLLSGNMRADPWQPTPEDYAWRKEHLRAGVLLDKHTGRHYHYIRLHSNRERVENVVEPFHSVAYLTCAVDKDGKRWSLPPNGAITARVSSDLPFGVCGLGGPKQSDDVTVLLVSYHAAQKVLYSLSYTQAYLSQLANLRAVDLTRLGELIDEPQMRYHW